MRCRLVYTSTEVTNVGPIDADKYIDEDDREADRLLTELEQRIGEWHVSHHQDVTMTQGTVTSRLTSFAPRIFRMRRTNRTV